MTWNPGTCESFDGRRMITRAFVAFGDPVPVTRPKRAGRRGKNEAGNTISGRVVKRSPGSKFD